MRTASIAGLLLGLTVAVQPALAQATKPADKASAPQSPSPVEFDKRLAQAQEQMRLMQAQMDKMGQTQDPKERQRLLQEHWSSMQSAMTTMQGIWGAGGAAMGSGMMMGGPMMGWGHMRGYYSSLTPEQLKQRQYMMDQYVPMQQMMMNHMMWHQHWKDQVPPAQK